MLLLEQVNILFQFVTGPKLFPWQSLHLTMSKQLSELLQHSMDKTYMLDAVLWRLTIQRYQLISASLIFFSDPQISSNNIPNAINILNLNNILMSLQYIQMQGVGWLILISIHKANCTWFTYWVVSLHCKSYQLHFVKTSDSACYIWRHTCNNCKTSFHFLQRCKGAASMEVVLN